MAEKRYVLLLSFEYIYIYMHCLFVLLFHCSLIKLLRYLLFFVALRPNAVYGLLIDEVSRSHTTTHHSR
jgi:hypothetical protein